MMSLCRHLSAQEIVNWVTTAMSNHVAAVCRARYYRLRQLRLTVKSLPVDAAKTLIQAFISNRLDNWITVTLLSVASQTPCLGSCSRFMQNNAARLLKRTGRRGHFTPVLRQLHWLSVSRRIDFKLAVLM